MVNFGGWAASVDVDYQNDQNMKKSQNLYRYVPSFKLKYHIAVSLQQSFG